MTSSANVYKRCRPLLGTFVEIAVVSGTSPCAFAAIERAFEAIERIAAQLSFHSPQSGLSRLNRAPVGRWVTVGDDLREVLTLASELQEKSGGQFNVAVGQALMCWSLLPGKALEPGWRHLSRRGFQVKGARARRLCPVQLDLGGIGKGYAVDGAVRSLELEPGIVAGSVNAGGDLRVFGELEFPVWVKSGAEDSPVANFARLKNRSLATSTVRLDRGVSPYVDIHRHKAVLQPRTAISSAGTCVVADAFTKIALLLSPENAQRLAADYGAEVRLVS